jgi:hypothetical protein
MAAPTFSSPTTALIISFSTTLGDKFEEVAFQKGVALPEDGNFISGMGLDFRDFNNDEYPDLVTVALRTRPSPCGRTRPGAGSRK